MGINDTTTHSGGSKYLEAIYHNSTTSIYNSTLVKERPWVEQLTSLLKTGSGSSFPLLAVRKSRESRGTRLGVVGSFE